MEVSYLDLGFLKPLVVLSLVRLICVHSVNCGNCTVSYIVMVEKLHFVQVIHLGTC